MMNLGTNAAQAMRGRDGFLEIKLAEIELQQHRPAAALATLKGIRLSKLTEAQQKMAKKVAGSAKKQVQDGVEDAEREW